MKPRDPAQRLVVAEHRLAAATARGHKREVAAWRIAVDVLRHLAGHDGAQSPR
jgi:hypothetical protein